MNESLELRDKDLLMLMDSPAYSLAESSRLVGITSGRVGRWLKGYEYRQKIADGTGYRGGTLDPVVHRERTAGTSYASFLDLIDLLFVRRFLDYGLSLQKVRRALDEAALYLGTTHFARDIFFTDGSEIYLQVRGEGRHILQLMSGGQWVIPSIIEKLAAKIDFHESTGYATRYFPRGRDGLIVIDPRVSFGRPSIVGKGTATANIYDLYCGESGRVERVSDWLDLTLRETKAAVGFELQLAA